MNYGEIKKTDIANGEGVRVTLFVSGCKIHCPGCFNSCTWDFEYGNPFTPEVQEEVIQALKPEYISGLTVLLLIALAVTLFSGLTVLGGEPFELENQKELVKFLSLVKRTYPEKTIWCYTGYIYDVDLLPSDGKRHCDVTEEMLSYIDVLVDGPFMQDLKDITLKFRGSRNQRILELKKLKDYSSSQEK